MDFSVSHPFIKRYLQYTENTESPKLMHIWAGLSGISACMGRRCWLPFGTGEIWPNMYVILVGPPAVRKSTAFLIMTKLLKRYTNVRFAPDDTGGQRQGLIAAMTDCASGGSNDEDEEVIKRLSAENREKKNATFTTLADLQADMEALGNISFDTRDPRSLYVAASELNSILGEGNTLLLTFLQKMFDGDSYRYKLKSTDIELKDCLLGMIGATTPNQIALAMPAEAVGQGFTSRAVFVYADQKSTRKIARPSLDANAEGEISDIYSKVFHEFNGPFAEHPTAAKLLDDLYGRGIVIKDPRFVHYTDRRHTHLQKLSMVLAASRGEMVIRPIDVEFADQLLLYTEAFMPDALGEYGMNKLSAAKQRLLDFLRTSDGPIPTRALYGMLAKDMSQIDFERTITELHNTSKLTLTNIAGIGKCVVAVSDNSARKARKDIDEIARLMAN